MDEKMIAAAVAGALAAVNNPETKQRTMTLGDQLASPFGCCNFFDKCGDGDLMSLFFSGRLPLLDWMGFNVSDVCYRTVEFMSYLRPAYTQGRPTGGYLSDPCADPNGIEYGSCKLTYEDFGRIGRLGPTRDLMKPKRYCVTQPLWRLDGTRVTTELEWDMKFVADQILNDINKLVVTGNALTAGQFDGLERWVRTGYDCSILDGTVIDWNGNPMTGGAGITWNGAAVAATYNFVDVLLAAYRRIKQRISWANRLQNERMRVGDMVILIPSHTAQCLLDHYTCWSVCDGSQYNEVALQSYEARQFRNNLMGGMFGGGRIFLDGFEIPLLPYDFELIKSPTLSDIYLLTGAVGGYRVWEGEHINATQVTAELGTSPALYSTSDGGRVLWRVDTENECRTLKGWMHPRLFCNAPWMQVRFQDVQCNTPGGAISPDATETSFYPLSSFGSAVCP